MSTDDLLHQTARRLPDLPTTAQAAGELLQVLHQGYVVTYRWHENIETQIARWIVVNIEHQPIGTL